MRAMPEETLLAFDFGEKKLGIAIGNTLTRHARPLEIIFSEVRDVRFSRCLLYTSPSPRDS